MSCDNYKEYTLPSCPEAFEVTADFTASQPMIWELKNKFGTKYRGNADTDSDGKLVITVNVENGLSADMFQSFSGAWYLTAKTVNDTGNELPVVFCGGFELLVLTFEKVIPAPDPNIAVIDLDCPSEA